MRFPEILDYMVINETCFYTIDIHHTKLSTLQECINKIGIPPTARNEIAPEIVECMHEQS